MSAQDTIPIRQMRKDGLCKLDNGTYSKTIQYEDINYQLTHIDTKNAIYNAWGNLLGSFDPSVWFQLSFVNLHRRKSELANAFLVPEVGDSSDSLRRELTEIGRNALEKGSSGIVSRKYITFGVNEGSMKDAKETMKQIELSLIDQLNKMGSKAEPLDGRDRLELMHNILHAGTEDPFLFKWNWLAETGLSVKDYVAPSSFSFDNGRIFRMGKSYCAVSFINIISPEIDDRILAKLLQIDGDMVVTMHMRSIDTVKALKMVKSTLTDIKRMKMDEQKKASRAGYDMDIIPADIDIYGNDVQGLLHELQESNEKLFYMNFLVMNIAPSKAQLKRTISRIDSQIQGDNNQFVRLDFRQEEGLISSLPLGLNLVNVDRTMPTQGAAAIVPFTTQELFQTSPESIYYGINQLSYNIILANRKLLKTPSGIILGSSGSGKSFAAKREMLSVFLSSRDHIMICDPEAEYAPLVRRLGGTIIHLSPTSTDYINLMDINLDGGEEDPVGLKSDFILSFCELVAAGKDGLTSIETTVIDRCVKNIYRRFLADPSPETMPILEDLYNELKKQEEKEAHNIATALEIYVTGSLNVFNHRTSIDVNNRLVCYDIRDLGKQLKKLGMLIVQEAVWNRVSANRSEHISTWYYIDEMHLLLKDSQTRAYTIEIWKRFRKWGGIPTGITQNASDLINDNDTETILGNSDFICMLNLDAKDRKILGEKLGISNEQLEKVTHCGEGQGLMFFGDVIIPFIDRFPKDTELYSIMTTKWNEVK